MTSQTSFAGFFDTIYDALAEINYISYLLI